MMHFLSENAIDSVSDSCLGNTTLIGLTAHCDTLFSSRWGQTVPQVVSMSQVSLSSIQSHRLKLGRCPTSDEAGISEQRCVMIVTCFPWHTCHLAKRVPVLDSRFLFFLHALLHPHHRCSLSLWACFSGIKYWKVVGLSSCQPAIGKHDTNTEARWGST